MTKQDITFSFRSFSLLSFGEILLLIILAKIIKQIIPNMNNPNNTLVKLKKLPLSPK
ncbi:hypothetical protein [Paenibacillus ferrarius]|uniref:hypothetical protein n=1 Tax=Paenibacillus ferrarius TaxID=1469647 RepID=UPI003D2880F2